MASIGHFAVGMAAARVYRRHQPTRWALVTSMVVWSFLSVLADVDVLGSRFGIAYSDPWGHRGATHSLFVALGLSVALGMLAPIVRLPALRTAVVAGVVLASHGLLDALTDGGLGCALVWPFSARRYFAPLHPIPVAPIGRAFLSRAGLHVAIAELTLFAPLLIYALWPRRRTDRQAGG